MCLPYATYSLQPSTASVFFFVVVVVLETNHPFLFQTLSYLLSCFCFFLMSPLIFSNNL